MNKKIILLIIPIVLIILSVHLFSRFRIIEDNLKYQYGTPIASVEIVDEDNKIVLFSIEDNIGLTTYTKTLGFYNVQDDYGHTRVKEDVYVVLSDRGIKELVLWGRLNMDLETAEFVFKKDEKEIVLDLMLEDQYFYKVVDSELAIDDSWTLSINYNVEGDLHQIENVLIKKDF